MIEPNVRDGCAYLDILREELAVPARVFGPRSPLPFPF
jgi:hypothetical protein